MTPFQDIAHFKRVFSIENGGFGPGINWYRAQLQNINEADEKGTMPLQIAPFGGCCTIHGSHNAVIPESNQQLTHPTLLLTGSKNFISSAAQFAEQMKPFVGDFEAKALDSGHWIQLEKAQEVNEILEWFFKSGGEE
jgi:soluble epoxide hydrolase / lipid-phosphate phosphatase